MEKLDQENFNEITETFPINTEENNEENPTTFNANTKNSTHSFEITQVEKDFNREKEEDEEFIEDLVELLQTIYMIYLNCLTPIEDTLDDRMGIRRCVNRMLKIHSISAGHLSGIPTAALILHRPQGQVFFFFFN